MNVTQILEEAHEYVEKRREYIKHHPLAGMLDREGKFDWAMTDEDLVIRDVTLSADFTYIEFQVDGCPDYDVRTLSILEDEAAERRLNYEILMEIAISVDTTADVQRYQFLIGSAKKIEARAGVNCSHDLALKTVKDRLAQVSTPQVLLEAINQVSPGLTLQEFVEQGSNHPHMQGEDKDG